MARREHEPETVWTAEELYCVDRLPMREVARKTGVSKSQLWVWADKYGWKAKRAEIMEAQSQIRADMIRARSSMLKELIDSKDPMTGFAVEKLERLALLQAEAAKAGQVAREQAAAPLRKIETPEDAAEALKEAVGVKLAAMLADPAQVNFKAVADIRKALELAGSMQRETTGQKADRQRGLSRETVEQLRKEILGA